MASNYEVYFIDPNGDDHLLGERAERNAAVALWCDKNAEYRKAGGSVEIWQDGKPVTEKKRVKVAAIQKKKSSTIYEDPKIPEVLRACVQGQHLDFKCIPDQWQPTFGFRRGAEVYAVIGLTVEDAEVNNLQRQVSMRDNPRAAEMLAEGKIPTLADEVAAAKKRGLTFNHL